ncbi:hypothetical protein Hanom_Chr06g00554751 [Helianthus anomalus]
MLNPLVSKTRAEWLDQEPGTLVVRLCLFESLSLESVILVFKFFFICFISSQNLIS